MSSHRISVAMCTYNGARFLPEQLASIAAQTRLPDELVICDDGSTDATAEIVEEFARTAPFQVRFIRNAQNLGSTKNFEKAIGLCTGDLIALSDQDDIWLPEKLGRQSGMMERDPELGGVFSDAELVDENARLLGSRLWAGINFTPGDQRKFKQGKEVQMLLKHNVVTGATFMLRADLRPLVIPIPAVWIHDGWIAWMLALHSKLDFSSERLIRYRLHAGQLTGSVLLRDGGTLRQRLATGKREEPAKHLAHARELEVLYQSLVTRQDPKVQAVLPPLRQAIRFFSDCGTPCSNYLRRSSFILRNMGNYHRYQNGWRSLIRDLVLMLIPMNQSEA